MRNDDIKDERVLAVRRKIAGETLQLLAIALFIAVLLQRFILKAPPAQYMVEWALLVAAATYLMLRSFAEGISPFPLNSQVRVIIFSLAIGVLPAPVINFVLDTFVYGPGKIYEMVQPQWILWVSLICGIVLSFILLESIYLRDKRIRGQEDGNDG